jgi:hypothetical protein
LEKNGNKITMQIFDLAGQDAYMTARKSFYKGGQAAFLVFDVQDPETLQNLKKWIDDSIENSGGSIGTFIMLGNKADLTETRQVSNEMAIEYARQLSAQTGLTFVFLETSAKTGLNIDLAFDIMSNRLLRKFNVDIPLKLPDGVEMISPNDVGSAPSAATPATPAATAASTKANNDLAKQISALSSRMDEMNGRLDQLEERFSKLAQIVKNLVNKG